MNRISFILGIYLLALAIVPCADGTTWDQYDMDDSLGLEWSENVDRNHDNDTKDYCSPLCNCGCCHITVRPPVKLDWQLEIPSLVLIKAPIIQSEVWDFACLDDIWQPPRFG